MTFGDGEPEASRDVCQIEDAEYGARGVSLAIAERPHANRIIGVLDTPCELVDKIAASTDGISAFLCKSIGGAKMYRHSSIAGSRSGQMSSNAGRSSH
jgi:hypothetical protein